MEYLILPVAVFLNRFAADLFVFFLGITSKFPFDRLLHSRPDSFMQNSHLIERSLLQSRSILTLPAFADFLNFFGNIFP